MNENLAEQTVAQYRDMANRAALYRNEIDRWNYSADGTALLSPDAQRTNQWDVLRRATLKEALQKLQTALLADAAQLEDGPVDDNIALEVATKNLEEIVDRYAEAARNNVAGGKLPEAVGNMLFDIRTTLLLQDEPLTLAPPEMRVRKAPIFQSVVGMVASLMPGNKTAEAELAEPQAIVTAKAPQDVYEAIMGSGNDIAALMKALDTPAWNQQYDALIQKLDTTYRKVAEQVGTLPENQDEAREILRASALSDLSAAFLEVGEEMTKVLESRTKRSEEDQDNYGQVKTLTYLVDDGRTYTFDLATRQNLKSIVETLKARTGEFTETLRVKPVSPEASAAIDEALAAVEAQIAAPEATSESAAETIAETAYAGPSRTTTAVPPGVEATLKHNPQPVQDVQKELLAGLEEAVFLLNTLGHENPSWADNRQKFIDKLRAPYQGVEALALPDDQEDARETLHASTAPELAEVYYEIMDEMNHVFDSAVKSKDGVLTFSTNDGRSYSFDKETAQMLKDTMGALQARIVEYAELDKEVLVHQDSVASIDHFIVEENLYDIALERQANDASFVANLEEIQSAYASLNLSHDEKVHLRSSLTAIGKISDETLQETLSQKVYDIVMVSPESSDNLDIDQPERDRIAGLQNASATEGYLWATQDTLTLGKLLTLGEVLYDNRNLMPGQTPSQTVDAAPAAETAPVAEPVAETPVAEEPAVIAPEAIDTQAFEAAAMEDIASQDDVTGTIYEDLGTPPEYIDDSNKAPETEAEARVKFAQSLDFFMERTKDMIGEREEGDADKITSEISFGYMKRLGNVLENKWREELSLQDVVASRDIIEKAITDHFQYWKDTADKDIGKLKKGDLGKHVLNGVQDAYDAMLNAKHDFYVLQAQSTPELVAGVESLRGNLSQTLESISGGDVTAENAGPVFDVIKEQIYGHADATFVIQSLQLAAEGDAQIDSKTLANRGFRDRHLTKAKKALPAGISMAMSARDAVVKGTNEMEYFENVPEGANKRTKETYDKKYAAGRTLSYAGLKQLVALSKEAEPVAEQTAEAAVAAEPVAVPVAEPVLTAEQSIETESPLAETTQAEIVKGPGAMARMGAGIAQLRGRFFKTTKRDANGNPRIEPSLADTSGSLDELPGGRIEPKLSRGSDLDIPAVSAVAPIIALGSAMDAPAASAVVPVIALGSAAEAAPEPVIPAFLVREVAAKGARTKPVEVKPVEDAPVMETVELPPADAAAETPAEAQEEPLTLDTRYYDKPRRGMKIAKTVAASIHGKGAKAFEKSQKIAASSANFAINAGKNLRKRGVVIGIGSTLSFAARYGVGIGAATALGAAAGTLSAPLLAATAILAGGATIIAGMTTGAISARLNNAFDEYTASGQGAFRASISALQQTILDAGSGALLRSAIDSSAGLPKLLSAAHANVMQNDAAADNQSFMARAFRKSTRYLRTMGEAGRIDAPALRMGMNTLLGGAGAGIAYAATHMHLLDNLFAAPHVATPDQAVGTTPTVPQSGQQTLEVNRLGKTDRLGTTPTPEQTPAVTATPDTGGTPTVVVTDPRPATTVVVPGTNTGASTVVATPTPTPTATPTVTATPTDPVTTTVPRVTTPTPVDPAATVTAPAATPSLTDAIAAAASDADKVKALMHSQDMQALLAKLTPAQHRQFSSMITAATNRGSFRSLNNLIDGISEGGRFNGNHFTALRGLRPDHARALELRQLVQRGLSGTDFQNNAYDRALNFNNDHMAALQGQPSKVGEWVQNHPRVRPATTPAVRSTGVTTPAVTTSANVPTGSDPIGDLITRLDHETPVDTTAAPVTTVATPNHNILDRAEAGLKELFGVQTARADGLTGTTVTNTPVEAASLPPVTGVTHGVWTTKFSTQLHDQFVTRGGMPQKNFDDMLTGVDKRNPGSIRQMKSWSNSILAEDKATKGGLHLTDAQRAILKEAAHMHTPRAHVPTHKL